VIRVKTLLGLLSITIAAAATAAAPLQTIDMTNKTALVTGSTSGLGEVVARRLGKMGAIVIVHGLDEVRGRAIASEITAAGPGRALFRAGDLSSLDEVRKLAARIRADHPQLHLLVNNAGILGRTGDPRRESKDGHELTFAINYLAHFLLTRELLPQLQAGAPARVVNVASGAQRPVDFDDVMLKRDYSSITAYSQSKLAQVTFTMTLAEQLDPARVTVNALHPATMMNTPMVLDNGMQARSSVEDGADAVMQLAVGTALAGRTGLYFNQMNEARAHAQAYDVDARKRLWDLSVALTQARPLAQASIGTRRALVASLLELGCKAGSIVVPRRTRKIAV
jgi:NAD(P)-dependent dehydrogenase (short-subunit alcohol dehydrogenase family)